MPGQGTFNNSEEFPAKGTVEELFPLRLTAFENYMFVDDRPSHPMSFVIEIAFSGSLVVDALKQAIDAALRRHPLLTACVTGRMWRRCWVPCKSPVSIDVLTTNELPSTNVPRLDLRTDPGVQIWIVPENDGGRVFFNFHHAATDGLGSMQFIGDVLVFYARQTAEEGQELPELRDVDVEVLKVRDCLENPGGQGAHGFWSRFRDFRRQLGRSASRLVPPPSSQETSSQETSLGKGLRPLPPYVSQTCDRDFVKELKRAAARRMLHVNDLYVASMFKTIHDWNRRYGKADGRRIIRLALPSSLRLPAHDDSPAANIVNMIYVNRLEAECGDLNALLDRADEAKDASTHDRMFYRSMRFAGKVPGLLEVASRTPYCFATMVLTNVGDVKRQFSTRFPLSRGKCVAGSITLEGLRGTAPLRPGTHVGLSVGTYAGELLLNAACDPHTYTRPKAMDFLNLFLSQLDELTEKAGACRAA